MAFSLFDQKKFCRYWQQVKRSYLLQKTENTGENLHVTWKKHLPPESFGRWKGEKSERWKREKHFSEGKGPCSMEFFSGKYSGKSGKKPVFFSIP